MLLSLVVSAMTCVTVTLLSDTRICYHYNSIVIYYYYLLTNLLQPIIVTLRHVVFCYCYSYIIVNYQHDHVLSYCTIVGVLASLLFKI